MNVLDSIKGTLLSVPKGISTGIKALSSHELLRDPEEQNADNILPELDREQGHVQEFNYDAGAELLSKFQNAWSDMHQKSEANAKEAKVVDKQISELFLHSERQKEAVGLFLQEISLLPQLLHDLQTTTKRVQNLEQQFEVVESELMKLEDTCERQELQRNMKHHEHQLMAYRQRCAVELEQAKVKMAKEHAVKVQRYEYNLQRGLREKQQAFEASFKEEMQHYKKYGKPSKQFQVSKSSPGNEADLSSFLPDTNPADEAVLNEFLQVDSDQDTSNTVKRTDAAPKHPDSSHTQTSSSSVMVATDMIVNTQYVDDGISGESKVDDESVTPTTSEPNGDKSNDITSNEQKEDSEQEEST